ncbi:MAG TPA: hypothetical protein VFA85_14840 [Terriglobales bacterium]|nr:hypothetical protein [Terriglobales bacterium]
MKKFSLTVAASVLGLAITAYAVDYLLWRYKITTGKNAYQTLTVQYYYAIGEKNGKIEYDYQPPQPEACVNALFPHAGSNPCWYERKHTEKAIEI